MSQKEEEEENWWDNIPLIPFQPHSSFCLSGATNSGKTTWIRKLIRHRCNIFGVDNAPDHIVYCFGIWQKAYEEMERDDNGIIFHNGLPTPDMWESHSHTLIILDDLSRDVVSNAEMEKIFVQGTHHAGISCVFVTQNLFMGGKHARTIALNTTYNVLFRNPRDTSQIQTLGRQLFPGHAHLFKEAFIDATRTPYGYLVLDLSPNVEETYRCRTSIFPGECPILYQV